MGTNLPAILNFIRYTSLFSSLLPLVFFLLKKIHSKEKSLKVIFYYILYCTINDATVYYLFEIRSQTIFVVLALFSLAEFTFFCLFYSYVLPPGLMKRSISVIWTLFFLFAIFDFFFINKTGSFDSTTVGVESLLTILMCIYYLMVQIKGSNDLFVYSTSNFWIIITFLIYLSGLFFLYIMAENMIASRAFKIQYTIINSVFNILKNVLLSVAMLMKATPIKNKLQQNSDYREDNFSYNLKK